MCKIKLYLKYIFFKIGLRVTQHLSKQYLLLFNGLIVSFKLMFSLSLKMYIF